MTLAPSVSKRASPYTVISSEESTSNASGLSYVPTNMLQKVAAASASEAQDNITIKNNDTLGEVLSRQRAVEDMMMRMDSRMARLEKMIATLVQASAVGPSASASRRLSVGLAGLDDETAMEMVRAPSASQKADHTSLDPKKARRVLANRQSAQRSRLRKLQYISELEKRVNSMQAEAAGVEAQVLEFQQNTTSQATELEQLKQKLNSLQSQMQYKDALFETLKAELDTLRQANVMASTSMSPPQSSPGYLPADPSVATGILPTSMPPALASDVPLIDEKADEGMWPSGALAGELST